MKYKRKLSHTKKTLTLEEINRDYWRKNKKKVSNKRVHPKDMGLVLGWTKTRSEIKREALSEIEESLAA